MRIVIRMNCARSLKPDEVFAHIPLSVLTRYSYYNVAVKEESGDPFNLWQFIANVATRDDHVTLKLDIDDINLEQHFFRELKSSAALQALIDEMAFEDHVNCEVMRLHWDETVQAAGTTKTLADTYFDYRFLRQRGIRMHSWP
jgi:hypothetical protein